MSPRHPPHRYRGRLLTLVVGVVLVIVSTLCFSDPLRADAAPTQVSTHVTRHRATGSRESSFGIATFNILGSQHTLGPGGYGPGVVRARLTASLILHRHLDLVGMQEVQADQLGVLTRLLPSYQVWPASSLGRGSLRLQIAFKRSKFTLVEHGTITAPFDRQQVPIPWVLLRERASDRLLYVVTIHNSPRNLEAERDKATRMEVSLVDRLRATGHGVFLMGDANEKEEFFCDVVGGTDLESANGGAATSVTDCTPPEGYLPIDWIMGRGPFSFSDYAIDDDAVVEKASDHDLVHAEVTVRAKR